MIDTIESIDLYIQSRNIVRPDIRVYPKTGLIVQEVNGVKAGFNEYVRDNKLYIVIDGTMYNKAKLIFDSVNKNNLPQKRYKVLVKNNDITHPTIDNIIVADITSKPEVKCELDELVSIELNGIDTEINVEYLIKMLSEKKYKVITGE